MYRLLLGMKARECVLCVRNVSGVCAACIGVCVRSLLTANMQYNCNII